MNINDKENDFGLICNCAVRYACGRRTYISGVVPKFIENNLSFLDDRTICCMERDLREARDYGDEKIDKPDWIHLLSRLREEIANRDITTWQ